MNRSLRSALGRLRTSGTGELAGSDLGPSQRRALEHFARQTGSVQIQPRGRGVIYQIVLPAVVERHWRELAPMESEQLNSGWPVRAGNIARARSSKSAAHRHDIHYLLIKAKGDPVVWRNAAGQTLDLARATEQQGAAALAVSSEPYDDAGWSAPGDLWLVENQALFSRLDWLPLTVSRRDPHGTSVAYYSGQLPNALIDWLTLRPRAAALWFFPDYDGIGLFNYVRLRRKVGASARLWLMPDWQGRLARFGSTALFNKTQREFEAAIQRLEGLSEDNEVGLLINAMRSSAMALEQEVIWLSE